MFWPVAAFPSSMALKESVLRHLNPEVLAYINTQPNAYKYILNERPWNRYRVCSCKQKTCHLGNCVLDTLSLLDAARIQTRWWKQVRIKGASRIIKFGLKLIKDICSHIASLTCHKRLETKSSCHQQYSSVVTSCSQRSVNHTHTNIHTYFLSSRKWQAKRGRELISEVELL